MYRERGCFDWVIELMISNGVYSSSIWALHLKVNDLSWKEHFSNGQTRTMVVDKSRKRGTEIFSSWSQIGNRDIFCSMKKDFSSISNRKIQSMLNATFDAFIHTSTSDPSTSIGSSTSAEKDVLYSKYFSLWSKRNEMLGVKDTKWERINSLHFRCQYQSIRLHQRSRRRRRRKKMIHWS